MYRGVPTHPWAFAAACCGALLLILPIAGCGGGGDPSGSRESYLSADDAFWIKRTSTAANAGADAWKDVFTEGATPNEADGERLLANFIRPGEVEIDGDSATLQIELLDAEGKPIGQAEWKAVKGADGNWKFTSAPIPGG